MLLRCILIVAVCASCAFSSYESHRLSLKLQSKGAADRPREVLKKARLRLEASLGQGKQGLFNQHLSLLSFITIGVAAGADELLITGSKRRDKWAMDATWVDSRFSDIWNASALEAFLADRGIALLTDQQPKASGTWVLDELELQAHMEPGDAGDYVRRHVLQQIGVRQAARQHRTAAGPHTLQLPLRGLLLSTYTTHSRLHADVAHHVTFASRLQKLAEKAVASLLERSGASAFNGVHLRIEGDSPNVDFMHGRHAMLMAYTEAFAEADIDAALPLYLSSGVFESEPDFAASWKHNWSTTNSHKELLLDEADLLSLHSEQRAALDFLVLVKAQKFVGWAGSSFSFWAVEHRKMAGLPASSSFLVRREQAGSGIHERFILTNIVA